MEAAWALVKTCTAGELDLSTPSGRMVARMLGAAARHEVEHAVERMLRKLAQPRAGGAPHGGARRFGYESGMRAVRESEAAELRAAAGVLVGQTPTAIAKDWNTRRVRTSTGGTWTGRARPGCSRAPAAPPWWSTP